MTETLEVYACRLCGALVGDLDRPGGRSYDGLHAHNKSHGRAGLNAHLSMKDFSLLGTLDVGAPRAKGDSEHQEGLTVKLVAYVRVSMKDKERKASRGAGVR